MTGTDVARFFNAIGRKAAVGVPGETTFPMGGYFNEFRREGMTVDLVRELRTAVKFAIVAAGGDVTAITKNARTFSEWYSDTSNVVAVALLGRGGAVNVALMRAAKERQQCDSQVSHCWVPMVSHHKFVLSTDHVPWSTAPAFGRFSDMLR